MLTNPILERRLLYVKAGYEPLPCIGKRPVPASWPTIPIDLDSPATWSAVYPNATNTGIRTRRAPAVDIDIYDAVMAERIEDVLLGHVADSVLFVGRLG